MAEEITDTWDATQWHEVKKGKTYEQMNTFKNQKQTTLRSNYPQNGLFRQSLL